MVIKVIAIDGGGMYGCVANEVCIEIEKRIGLLKDNFDVFIATSTGSLIAGAALTGTEKYQEKDYKKYEDREGTLNFSKMKADKFDPKPSHSRSLGMSAKQIMMTYYTKGQKIFGKSNENTNVEIPFVNQLKYPKFSEFGLRLSVNEVMGEYEMGNLEERTKNFWRLGRKPKYLSISAFDMNVGKPHFFRSWDKECREMPIREAVMASSSGLLVLPLHRIFYKEDGCYLADQKKQEQILREMLNDPETLSKLRENEIINEDIQKIEDIQKNLEDIQKNLGDQLFYDSQRIIYYEDRQNKKTKPQPKVVFYADGGIFATNPANFALGEISSLIDTKKSIFEKDKHIVLVSIGTGKQVFSPNAESSYASIYWWARNIFDTFPVGQIESTNDNIKNMQGIMNNARNRDIKLDYYRFDVSLEPLQNKFGKKYRKKAPEIDFEVLDEARRLMRNKFKKDYQEQLHKMCVSMSGGNCQATRK